MNGINNGFIKGWETKPTGEYLPPTIIFEEGQHIEDISAKGLDGRWHSEQIGITPLESMSSEKADEIYNKVMESAFADETEKKTEISLEEVFDEIYNRDEDEFNFDGLDLKDEKIERLLRYFKPENWEKLDYYDRQNVLREFENVLAAKLELKNPPRIIYYSGGANDCGAYNSKTNEIKINRNLLGDAKETIDTLAHETYHAYQHQRAKALETRQDALYAVNFDNYIRPEQDANGRYVNFAAYEGQLVEAEARKFAKQFSEKVGA